MEKLKIGIFAIIACLFITGCGCSKKEEAKEFTVKFDSNGGTEVRSQTVEEGEKVSKPTNPTKEGYTFDGWYIDLDDEESYDFDTKITKDMTLIAKWNLATVNPKPSDNEKKCKLTCEAGYELVNGDSENCKCKKKVIGVSSITLSQTQATLLVGKSITVTATVNPYNAENKTITWSSSNNNVATVRNGVITAVGIGTAKITATAGGKSSVITITVTTQDQLNLNAALNSITPKQLEKGNTSINYSYNGCTITNTANTVSSNNNQTVVANGVVSKLHRALSNGNITSTYSVTCGEKTGTKTVNHNIVASGYAYTADYQKALALYVLKVANATDYTINVNGTPARYLASAEGAQVGAAVHTPGSSYTMTLNSDQTTIYAVRAA